MLSGLGRPWAPHTLDQVVRRNEDAVRISQHMKRHKLSRREAEGLIAARGGPGRRVDSQISDAVHGSDPFPRDDSALPEFGVSIARQPCTIGKAPPPQNPGPMPPQAGMLSHLPSFLRKDSIGFA